MQIFKMIVFLLSDIVLFLDILTFIHITQQSLIKKSRFLYFLCFVINIIVSLLFYSFYFVTDSPVFRVSLFLLYFIRFPLIILKLTKLSFLKGLYITIIISQSCDLIQLLMCNIAEISQQSSKYCVSLIIRLILLLTLILLTRNEKKERLMNIIRLIPKRIYILIALNILLMGALTSVIRYETSNSNAQIVSINVVLLLIFVISIIITISLISNCISKTFYNSVNSILEKQIKSQIEHYNQTEILNSNLRRFKHDYTNHILCLKAMIGSNQNSEALEYIDKINSEISLSAKAFNTGHKIADAILNEKHRIHSDIHIRFEGCIPDFIDNVDLCIVLGNAVDNAVEACDKLNDTDKIITVTANYQQSHFILIIKNPVEKDYIINGNFPETTKEEPLKHGFGLSNIKHVADKYDGDMSVEAVNGIFTLYLALKVN